MALQDALGTTGDPISRAMGAGYGRKPAEAQTPEQGMQSRIARGTIAEEQLPGLMEAQRAEAETSQADIAAKRMGVAKSRIAALSCGEINAFDIEALLGMARAAGFKTVLHIS